MSRERRRRINDNVAFKQAQEDTNNLPSKEKDSKVVFMESIDYKMEIEDKIEPKKMILIKNQEHSEEEKR
jgi:hypothetical protein